jgi:hypothetical protein
MVMPRVRWWIATAVLLSVGLSVGLIYALRGTTLMDQLDSVPVPSTWTPSHTLGGRGVDGADGDKYAWVAREFSTKRPPAKAVNDGRSLLHRWGCGSVDRLGDPQGEVELDATCHSLSVAVTISARVITEQAVRQGSVTTRAPAGGSAAEVFLYRATP